MLVTAMVLGIFFGCLAALYLLRSIFAHDGLTNIEFVAMLISVVVVAICVGLLSAGSWSAYIS